MAIIRGAICAKNSIDDIRKQSLLLVQSIVDKNNIQLNDISAILFSVTDDLNIFNPATAVREQLNLPNVAFMCFQEMKVVGALTHCIRVGVIVESIVQSTAKHVYLGQAQQLRTDLK